MISFEESRFLRALLGGLPGPEGVCEIVTWLFPGSDLKRVKSWVNTGGDWEWSPLGNETQKMNSLGRAIHTCDDIIEQNGMVGPDPPWHCFVQIFSFEFIYKHRKELQKILGRVRCEQTKELVKSLLNINLLAKWKRDNQ